MIFGSAGPDEGYDPGTALARTGAQVLIFGAGLVTVVNSTLSPLHRVDASALRLTGLATMFVSFAVLALPWRRNARYVSGAIFAAALVALVGTDYLHHYSRDSSALAVYPIFFVLVIGYAGLTQPRGAATAVAAVSGVALAWLLHVGGHGSATWQCVVVTVPAAAILGELISWTHTRAMQLAVLDSQRRDALEALVWGATRLQDALTPEEAHEIVIETANAIFGGTGTTLTTSVDASDDLDDVVYRPDIDEMRVSLRGQTGPQGLLTTRVAQPDEFVFDAARLFGRQIGTRLEQLKVIHALTDAATLDVLTGLGNRRAAEFHLKGLKPGDTVFLLDLDHFKTINDSCGHRAGDEVLADLGDYLRGATRPNDLVARYGGDEFLLVCKRTTPDTAARIATRLIDGWHIRCPTATFSIGYAIHADDQSSVITLERADMSLYEAKRRGRDRAIAFHAEGTQTAIPRRDPKANALVRKTVDASPDHPQPR
jgi:diguanylate cyclase (GGDEF)-like protein